jgi:hypothetical protein
MTTRISYLDRFRFLVVTLAIMSHVISKHGVMETALADTMFYLRILTRTATPSLLVLLGVMVSIVYVSRFMQEPRVVATKILKRTLQCYAAFLVIVLVGLLFGIQDVRHSLLAVPFVTMVRQGHIFQLYVLLLPVAIGLIWVQVRFGPLALGLLAVLIWVVEPLVATVVPPRHLGGLAVVAIGSGNAWGPSAYHGISLVAFGMLVGNALASQSQAVRRQSMIAVAALLAGAAVVLAAEALAHGPGFVADSIVNSRGYRWHNELPYFAFGAIGSVVVLAVSWFLSRTFSPRIFATPDRVGRSTLTYFLIGEVLILTLPDPTLDSYATLLPTLVFYVGVAGLLAISAQHIMTAFFNRYAPALPAQKSGQVRQKVRSKKGTASQIYNVNEASSESTQHNPVAAGESSRP